MTPTAATLAAVTRRRRALVAANHALVAAIVAAVDDGHPYRTVAERTGFTAGYVHAIVKAARAQADG